MTTRRPATLRGLVAVATLAVSAFLVSATASQGAGASVAAGLPTATTARAAITRPPLPAYVPPVKRGFVINFGNEGYDETWSPGSEAPYLARHLPRQGVLLNSYYATAHNSLPDYIAQISGQASNPTTQVDCLFFEDFVSTAPIDASGKAVGGGCVYPKEVPTLPSQMSSAQPSWMGYLQQMPAPCSHPALGASDDTAGLPVFGLDVYHNGWWQS